MDFLTLLTAIAAVVAIVYVVARVADQRSRGPIPTLAHMPEHFIVFDLETTGLDPATHEIIEYGAIKVNRDSTNHATWQSLVRTKRKLPTKIVEMTGITAQMLAAEGEEPLKALDDFLAFVGDLPLVSFNCDFDMGFVNAACEEHGRPLLNNRVACALKMARRAWPGRKSYRLADLAKDGNLNTGGAHRAIADAHAALIVYGAASSNLKSAT